jgi:hypothetical protein
MAVDNHQSINWGSKFAINVTQMLPEILSGSKKMLPDILGDTTLL